jgi:hypothetical protein
MPDCLTEPESGVLHPVGVRPVDDDFDTRFSFLQWGIDDHRLGKLLRELGGLSGYHFGNLYAWINNKQCLWYKEDDVKAADPSELSRKAIRASEIKKELEDIARKIPDTSKSDAYINDTTKMDVYTNRQLSFREYVWAASATSWLLSLLLFKKKYEYGQDIPGDIPVDSRKIIENGAALLEQFKALWRARNRESELRDVVGTFEKILASVSRF